MEATDCKTSHRDRHKDLVLAFPLEAVKSHILEIDEMQPGAVVKMGLTGKFRWGNKYFYGRDLVLIGGEVSGPSSQ